MTDTIIVLQNEREEAGTMILKEKERTTIEDLQTQEKSCIEKYGRYAQQAKDPELYSNKNVNIMILLTVC